MCLCGVVLCCVVLCGVVWCCVVLCCTLKTPCVDSKRFPCVDSKRPRICRHHAHILKSMWAWCRYTQGRFEPTHGKRFESTHGGHRQFCLPRTAHVGLSLGPTGSPKGNHWILPMFKFEKRSRTTCSRFLQSHPLYLILLLSSSYPGGNVGGYQP